MMLRFLLLSGLGFNTSLQGDVEKAYQSLQQMIRVPSSFAWTTLLMGLSAGASNFEKLLYLLQGNLENPVSQSEQFN